MHTETTTKNHYLRAAVVFGACLLAVFLLPLIAIYLLHSMFLFSVPQLLFPYDSLVVRGADSSRAVFSHHTALALNWLQWGLISIGFVWFARRIPVRYAILAAVAVIIILGIATNVAFGLFGMTVEIDAP